MSDGLKTGLILGGAGLVAFLLYQKSHVAAAVAAGVPAVPGAGSNLATSPGAAPAGATAPPSSGGGGNTSVAKSVIKYAAIATVAPFYYPTKVALSGTKYVGNAVENVFKSIF